MAPTTTPTRMSAWLEQAWLIQYLDRQLAEEEAQWFESYAMDRPELLATIEADTRLRDALAAAASTRHTDMSVDGGGRPGGATEHEATGSDAGSTVSDDAASGSSTIGFALRASLALKRTPPRSQSRSRRVPTPPAWLAIAASLLAGIGIGWSGLLQTNSDGASSVIASPTRIIYDTMRGGPTLPRVEHADSHSAYVLVEIAVPLGAEQITLDIGDGSPRALARSPDGFVTFLADRNTLAAATSAHVDYRAGGQTQMRPLHFNLKGV